MQLNQLALGALLSLGIATAVAAPSPPYADYQMLTQNLERLAKAHRDLVSLKSLGTTGGGRNVWLVQVAGSGPVPPEERPALFMAANLEGDQLAGSALATATLEQLLDSYGKDAAVKAQLDSTTLYIVPRVNPDAAEDMFAKVRTGRRTNMTPFDDDNDGRTDEDGPEDLNGDGLITVMRVPDPEGDYMIDPADARLMKKADRLKGERGTYKLYWEGIDNDGDGYYNEDPPGGVDINRNFQHNYPYYQPDAGHYMVGETESRAVMDFLISHRNVAALMTFGASDNLVIAPDKQGELAGAREVDLYNFVAEANEKVLSRRSPPPLPKAPPESATQPMGRHGARPPATTVNPADREYFAVVSEKYRELTGIKNLPMVRRPQGALFEYGYYQFGVPSFSTPGWGMPESDKPAPATAAAAEAQRAGRMQERPPVAIDAQLLQWFDKDKIDGFVPWAAYKHPTLKNVEIGGFSPYAITNPPAAVLDALAPAQTKFTLYLASLLPRVRIASVEVQSKGGNLYRITAEVQNDGFFPTSLAHGVVSRSVKPTMVQLGLPPEKVVAGIAKTTFVPVIAGSGGRAKFEWMVEGERGQKIDLKVQAQKGGTVVHKVTLQ